MYVKTKFKIKQVINLMLFFPNNGLIDVPLYRKWISGFNDAGCFEENRSHYNQLHRGTERVNEPQQDTAAFGQCIKTDFFQTVRNAFETTIKFSKVLN